jgi:type I restriction enzyme S subunit
MNEFVPDGWKRFSIKEIGTVVTGSTPPKKYPENYGGDLPWIKPPDLNNEMVVFNSSETISEIGRQKIRLLPKGTVLISCIGNIGKIAIAGHELCTNQQINSIIPNEKIVDSVFLYFTIRRMQPYMQKMASKAVVPLLNKTNFSNIIVNLPPLPTQKKIVAILEKAEELKGWRREADELTDEFLKSTFLEMFGDPVKNPKTWNVSKLGDVLSEKPQNGLYLPKEKYVIKGGTEMVHMSDAFNCTVIRGNLKQVAINDEGIKKYNLDHNDILIARRSLNYEGSAKPCRIPISSEPLVFESSLIKLTPNQEIISPIYLYTFLNDDRARKSFVFKYVTKSTISGINQSALKKIDILVPPLALQNKFANIVQQIEQLQKYQTQSSQHINDLSNTLMQQAFRGELT